MTLIIGILIGIGLSILTILVCIYLAVNKRIDQLETTAKHKPAQIITPPNKIQEALYEMSEE